MRGVLQLGILLCQLWRGDTGWKLGHNASSQRRWLGLSGRDYISILQQRRMPYQLRGSLVRRWLQCRMRFRLANSILGYYTAAPVRRNRVPGRLYSIVLLCLPSRLRGILVGDGLLSRLWRRDIRQ